MSGSILEKDEYRELAWKLVTRMRWTQDVSDNWWSVLEEVDHLPAAIYVDMWANNC